MVKPPAKRDINASFTKIGYVKKREAYAVMRDEVSQRYPFWDIADKGAFTALAEGRAEPHQQKQILNWLAYATGMEADQFMPSERDTNYALGRRSIGLAIRRMIDARLATGR